MSMMLPLGLAAVIDLCKKMMKVGGRTRRRSNIIKADSRSPAICIDIPEEILIEILVRLPADSLMRFKCVSRHWSSLISSRYFTNLFFKFSSSTTQGCRVFMTVVDKYQYSDFKLFSSLLSNLDTTVSFPQFSHDLNLSGMKGMPFLYVVRGLMCFKVKRAIQIINLTTKQVLNLPQVKSNMLESCGLASFFGYDSVNDEYKVLTTIFSFDEEWRVISETQVLVLGAGALWRNTRSRTSPPPPHLPYDTKGISINNVLYYGVLSFEKKFALMSFDLNSEEFNWIELPIETRTLWRDRHASVLNNLINYQGHVTLVDDFRLNTECTLDLWVVEDARKNKWSHKDLVLPCHQLKLNLDIDELLIRGTGRSREIILYGRTVNTNKKIAHAIYDLETNRVTREVVIESLYSRFSKCVETTLWYDVENIMYLAA